MAVCLTCNTDFHGGEQFCPRDGTPLQVESGGDRLVGRVLSGRYRLLSLLGQGGMGAVYRAHHILMDKPVAVKVLRQEVVSNAEAVARFHREARSASRLDHDNIIRVTDFGQSDDGLLFLVMEILDGEGLSEVIRRGPLPWRRAVAIGIEVAQGLAHAHEQGIIHRDLKPENIILARRGKSSRLPAVAKVLDFGLAKLRHDIEPQPERPQLKSLTRTGVVFGTPEYMSPEQAEGAVLDHRTDLYAFGVLCYQMVTGQVPFSGGNFLTIITKTVNDPPEPPSQRLPGLELPAELEALILRCLEKSPAARPQSAEELLEELRLVLARHPQQGGAGTDPAPVRTPTPSAPPLAPAAAIAPAEAHASTLGLPALTSAPGLSVPVAVTEPGPPVRARGRATLALGLGAALMALSGALVVPRVLDRSRHRPVPGQALLPPPPAITPVSAPEPDRLAPARTLLTDGRADEALEVLEKERLQRNSPALQRLLSAAYEAKKNHLRALGHMQMAVRLARSGPEEHASRLALAELLYRIDQPQPACATAAELLAEKPAPEIRRSAEVLRATLRCPKKP